MTGETVLVADDSLVVRAVVRAHLEASGYVVLEAVDGSTAVEQCQQHPIDAILLDIEMPGLDGYETLAVLKSDPLLKDLPVVFLTNRNSMQDILAGLRGGAHDYLKKPFEPAELVARVGSAVHVKKLQDELRRRNEELDLVSRLDVLTTLYNRRHLDDVLSQWQADSNRHHNSFGLVLLDIDHFKAVNDTFGHQNGDLVLSAFAARLKQELRAGDIAGRWGGEEFMIVLPRTDLVGTIEVAERVRRASAEMSVDVGEQQLRVTVSGGCAVGPLDTVEDLVLEVDRRLYLAKSGGRDRIVASASR